MQKSCRFVWLIYLAGIIIYFGIIHLFTIPVHLSVDEELYISMARSFHYEGVFAKGGEVLNYSCVLYSMLLSLAYYFYSPENILLAFRTINVIIMLSSVFPTFLLGRSIFKDEKKTLIICGISLFLPTMMDTAYCMQESLAYPLFLWIAYFIYREIEEDKLLSLSKESIIIAVLSIVCYFTKTYMIFIPLVYCGFLFIEAVIKKYPSVWEKMVLFCGILLLLYVGGKFGILYINDGIEGANHYASQFSRLFPITGQTIIAAISCMIIYTAGLLFYWGVLPVILPLCNYKTLEEKDRKFFAFLFLSILVLIVEIVLSIVLTEEGNVLAPKKILYRYFQILEIPLFMVLLKGLEKMKFPKKLWAVYTAVFGTLIIYYIYIGDRQRTSIIDAPLYLFMENISRYVFPFFNVVVCILAAGIVGIGAWLYCKERKQCIDLLKMFNGIGIICIILLFVINLFQLPYYTNVIADGKRVENDAVEIAHYLMEDEGHTDIYFVLSDTDRYERAVYAYLEEKVICLSEKELETLNDKNAIVIASVHCELGERFQKTELSTEVLNVARLK